jgi:hypothetical protein
MKKILEITTLLKSHNIGTRLKGIETSFQVVPLFFGSPAYTITWRPSSISRARFVTAETIDPKLCTYVPLVFILGISKKDT